MSRPNLCCPSCKDPMDPLVRVSRSRAERWLLWTSRRFQCFRCGRVYLRILGFMIPRRKK